MLAFVSIYAHHSSGIWEHGYLTTSQCCTVPWVTNILRVDLYANMDQHNNYVEAHCYYTAVFLVFEERFDY